MLSEKKKIAITSLKICNTFVELFCFCLFVLFLFICLLSEKKKITITSLQICTTFTFHLIVCLNEKIPDHPVPPDRSEGVLILICETQTWQRIFDLEIGTQGSGILFEYGTRNLG